MAVIASESARRFRAVRRRAFATYCVATGLGTPVLLLMGIGLSPGGNGGLPLLGGGRHLIVAHGGSA
jgi:hypothetical protein